MVIVPIPAPHIADFIDTCTSKVGLVSPQEVACTVQDSASNPTLAIPRVQDVVGIGVEAMNVFIVLERLEKDLSIKKLHVRESDSMPAQPEQRAVVIGKRILAGRFARVELLGDTAPLPVHGRDAIPKKKAVQRTGSASIEADLDDALAAS